MPRNIFTFAMLALFTSSSFALQCNTEECFEQHIQYEHVLNLSSLDLADQDAPTILSFLNKHPELDTLYAAENHFTAAGALTIAKCTQLVAVDMNDNQIGDEGVIALANNPKLTDFYVDFTGIGIKSAAVFANNNHLKKLIVSNNYQFDDNSAVMLAKNTSITELDISNTPITATGLNAINKMSQLVDLIAGNIHLNDGIGDIATSSTLSGLYVNHSQLHLKDIEALAANTSITSLDISANEIGDAAAIAIAKNKTLLNLRCIGNHITDDGAVALAQMHSLRFVNLDVNAVGDKGAAAIAAMPNLEVVSLDYNKVGDAGAIALAKNVKLQNIYLYDNDIQNDGAIAFSYNTTLYLLDLRYNKIGTLGKTYLARNTAIKYLYYKQQK